MDPTIVSAIITAIVSALMGLIGLRFGGQSSIPTAREIRFHQLTDLFEPIERTIMTADDENLKQMVSEIFALLTENLKLVPSILLDEVTRLMDKPSLTLDDINRLYIINGSLYSWHCKHFGFPYEASRIVKKYTPTYNKQMLIKFLAPYVFAILSFILAAISTILSIYSIYSTDVVVSGQTVGLSPAIFLIVPLLFSVLLSLVLKTCFSR